jgi:hypothetical protein
MTNHGHLNFSSEDWDLPVEFFEGCWVIASKHNPGLLTCMELNNRVFVFKLRDRAGKDVLLVFGCGGPSTVAATRAIERKTGTKVGWIVGNGGGHHLFLSLWYDAFPEARVLVPAKRVPFTRNGLELQQKYASRWELMHGPKPKQLVEEFGREIDVVIFDQLFHYKDQNVAQIMASPKDHTSPPGSLSGFSLMMAMGKAMKDASQPNDEVTLLHRASGLVVGGHNYQFAYTPKGYSAPSKFKLKSGGFPMNVLMSMMMPKGKFASLFEGQPGPIADSKIHAAEWKMVLDWDLRAWTTAHNPPTICGPDLSGADLKAAIRASIARTGEDDPTGARLKWNMKHGARPLGPTRSEVA